MHLKLFQREKLKKAAEATGELIGNESADKITKVWIKSPQNSSETVTNETENLGRNREILKKYLSLEKR